MPGIDVHTHLAPVLAEGAVRGVETTADGRLTVDGHTVGPGDLYRPERLVAHLAAIDLDAAAVSIPPPFFRQGLGPGATESWVRAANDGLLAAVREQPALLPLAYLPLDRPQLALEEYARVRGEQRWAGLAASAGGRSVSLADPALAPLWRALDDDARLLLLHPGSSPDARMDEFYLGNLLGNPVETAVAAAQLVFGDVLPTHPRMRVLLVHCGGCAGGLVGRWERGVATARPGLRPLSEPPRTAVRRLHVDCLAHDPAVVSHAVEVFGPDKLLLGSDWPFPMGIEDPAELIAHLDDDLRHRIAVDNARAALGLRLG
ncbi:amidohydrolase family protein [Conexibacter woesei]|uniref:Amidohydrolase 2 n=1 Tax=Conexibacter woesei (strain DSM 14684 / CCUG 47730 / CIP 108061 / JCM 11494 / NBRC 100937 / ID131577) TaxID=469383 RepID=D3F3F1_CONWI|nr:amidohydrolase family protein [Conexibacter woesei]ADB52316.1 amidohydrolase 2 [Conexibacter woesei DSM 14684]